MAKNEDDRSLQGLQLPTDTAIVKVGTEKQQAFDASFRFRNRSYAHSRHILFMLFPFPGLWTPYITSLPSYRPRNPIHRLACIPYPQRIFETFTGYRE